MRYLDPKDIPQLTSVIEKLYNRQRYVMLRSILTNYYPTDIELAMRDMEPQFIANILKVSSPHNLVSIFQYLTIEVQLDILPFLRDYEIKFLFENLPDDDRTLLLREMDEEIKDKIFALINEKERETATNLLAYDEDTAASIASSHYAYTYKDYTVARTLERLRERSMKIESIYTIYVLNEENQLTGSITLEKLVFSDPTLIIDTIMTSDVISVNDNDSIEHAVELIEKYDLTTLPVINETHNLIGIITHDDAIDIIIRQGTEDIHRFGGITGHTGIQETYFKQSIWLQARRRLTWTILPVLMEIFTAAIIARGQEILNTVFILATYIPMITSAGGDIGSQSASMVIRGIALKEIVIKDVFRVLRKEFFVALIIASAVAGMIAIKMLIVPHASMPHVSFGLVILVVALAMATQLITAALLGSLIPLIATIFKIDPAAMSSPVLSSLVDTTGVFIYLYLAKLILL